ASGPGERGGWVVMTFFVVLLVHFFMNHRMPGLLALAARHVVFPRPTPQAQLLDEIQFRHDAAEHTLSPVRQHGTTLTSWVRLRKYIGGNRKFKNHSRRAKSFLGFAGLRWGFFRDIPNPRPV